METDPIHTEVKEPKHQPLDVQSNDAVLQLDISTETFELEYNSESRRKDSLQTLVTYPEDNLVVETFTKPKRTDYAFHPSVCYNFFFF